MTAREAFVIARDSLKGAGVAEPDAKAKEIVAHALGIGYADIFLYQSVSPQNVETIGAMARRCMRGEPVQYLTGRAYFRHLTLSVTPDALIPRRETELVAQKAIDLVRERGFSSALDMCTGSGCIAISLATETQAVIEACDVSETALALAKQNAADNGAAVRFFASDMFGSVTRAYDLIVCNPPYVSEEEYASLTEDVRNYEPKLALAAGDGYAYYRRITGQAAQHLSDGGMLVLEIGAEQAETVTALLARDFSGVACFKDYEGRDRIVAARKKLDCHV